MNKNRPWYVVGSLFAAAFVFQFFLRYDYVHLAEGRVMRIDRLTASSCYMPCLPPKPTPMPTETPKPTPVPTRAPIAYDIVDARIIDKMLHNASLYYPPSSQGYVWRIWGHFTPDGFRGPMSNPDPFTTPVRVVCYCNSKWTGWYWESTPASPYTLTTSEIEITGNTVLEQKYGFSHPK